MSFVGWIILVIVNIPVYIALGWVFFRTWDDFWVAIEYWATPDIVSLWFGKYWEDWWMEFKLFCWAAFCVVFVIVEAYVLSKFFG